MNRQTSFWGGEEGRDGERRCRGEGGKRRDGTRERERGGRRKMGKRKRREVEGWMGGGREEEHWKNGEY